MEVDGRWWSWWPGITRDVGKYVEGCDFVSKNEE